MGEQLPLPNFSLHNTMSDIKYLPGKEPHPVEHRLIFKNIDRAESSIEIFSPYVSDPLLSYVRNHKKDHVALNIISPGINNKNIFQY